MSDLKEFYNTFEKLIKNEFPTFTGEHFFKSENGRRPAKLTIVLDSPDSTKILKVKEIEIDYWPGCMCAQGINLIVEEEIKDE